MSYLFGKGFLLEDETTPKQRTIGFQVSGFCSTRALHNQHMQKTNSECIWKFRSIQLLEVQCVYMQSSPSSQSEWNIGKHERHLCNAMKWLKHDIFGLGKVTFMMLMVQKSDAPVGESPVSTKVSRISTGYIVRFLPSPISVFCSYNAFRLGGSNYTACYLPLVNP